MAVIKHVNLANTKFDIQSIEYIVGTQSSSTNAWVGQTTSAALDDGKCIAYKLPYAGTTSPATLNLTFSGSGTSGAKSIKMNGTENVTNQFAAGTVILMIYDGTYWQVLGGGSGDIEIVTTSENFVKTVSSTTTNITYNNGVLVFGTSTLVTGVTSTTGAAITSVDNDQNIANAYEELF